MTDLSKEDKNELLRKVSIFAEAGDDVIRSISRTLEELQVKQGRSIIKKGSSGDSMFILASGKVRIHDGNHVLARLTEGQVFGEYALIDQSSRSASVTADTDSVVLKLNAGDFYRLAAEDHNILRGVLKVLIGRMRDMNELEEKLSRSYLKIRDQNEKIERQNQNIKEQKELLEQQNYDLTRLNEEKNHLISTIIHQLRNPLASSLTLVEMLLHHDVEENTSEEALEIIRRSLQRINRLITENLDIGVIDSKVFELKYELIDLKEITCEIIENYKILTGQKQLQMDTSIEPLKAELNRVYFTQIVDNLLSNAIKFTPAGKEIRLKLQRKGTMVELVVSDDGPGIAREDIPLIFEQYRRQTPMKDQADSPAGLGLAIVKKYTESMGGTVHYEGKPGKGATFVVSLPAR